MVRAVVESAVFPLTAVLKRQPLLFLIEEPLLQVHGAHLREPRFLRDLPDPLFDQGSGLFLGQEHRVFRKLLPQDLRRGGHQHQSHIQGPVLLLCPAEDRS